MAMTAESLRAPLLFVIDIGNGLIQQPIRPQLMKGDKKANTIIVRVMDGNEPVDLTGATVTGSFISPVDGAEIPLTGSVSGNEASVTLADECYAEDGDFEANVKLTVGETARTILSITGSVLSKGSGAMIDIGGVIPSIDDIIAQYAAMKQAVEDANAARDAANNAAGNAENAATNANNAAAKIDGMTVSAVSGTSAAASISEQNGAKHISFTLPKGDKGDQGEPGKDGTGSGTVTGVKVGNQTYEPDGDGVVDLPAPDTTLKEAGKAADAGAVGTALSELKNDIDEKLPSDGTAADSNKLGGVSADQYALKTDVPESSNVDLLAAYPVGSIYMSVNEISPASLFGGTWEQIKGRFLIGTGAPDANDDGTTPGSYNLALGSKGGEAEHTLKSDEMPSHNHSSESNNVTGNIGLIDTTTQSTSAYSLSWSYVSDRTDLGIRVASNGGDQPHNNMPPFEAVNIWKRVA